MSDDDEGLGPDGADGYRGSVTLRVEGRAIAVSAELRGHLDPISGHYHWYGRLAADPVVTELAGRAARGVRLATPHGEVVTTLADADPWGRFRVSGRGRPPFRVLAEPPSMLAE